MATLKALLIGGFQSIREPTWIKTPGITLVVGPNSVGKSAIFDALDCLAVLCSGQEPKLLPQTIGASFVVPSDIADPHIAKITGLKLLPQPSRLFTIELTFDREDHSSPCFMIQVDGHTVASHQPFLFHLFPTLRRASGRPPGPFRLIGLRPPLLDRLSKIYSPAIDFSVLNDDSVNSMPGVSACFDYSGDAISYYAQWQSAWTARPPKINIERGRIHRPVPGNLALVENKLGQSIWNMPIHFLRNHYWGDVTTNGNKVAERAIHAIESISAETAVEHLRVRESLGRAMATQEDALNEFLAFIFESMRKAIARYHVRGDRSLINSARPYWVRIKTSPPNALQDWCDPEMIGYADPGRAPDPPGVLSSPSPLGMGAYDPILSYLSRWVGAQVKDDSGASENEDDSNDEDQGGEHVSEEAGDDVIAYMREEHRRRVEANRGQESTDPLNIDFPAWAIANYLSSIQDYEIHYAVAQVTMEMTDWPGAGSPEWLIDLACAFEEGVMDKPDHCGIAMVYIYLRAKHKDILLGFHEVGSGISCVLPILAASGCRGLTIIEQPELHLHPKGQVEVIDTIIAGQAGPFILETHSEHIVNRLAERVRMTRQGEYLKGLPNDGVSKIHNEEIAIYYCDKGAGEMHVEEMVFTPQGELLTDLPEDFFSNDNATVLHRLRRVNVHVEEMRQVWPWMERYDPLVQKWLARVCFGREMRNGLEEMTSLFIARVTEKILLDQVFVPWRARVSEMEIKIYNTDPVAAWVSGGSRHLSIGAMQRALESAERGYRSSDEEWLQELRQFLREVPWKESWRLHASAFLPLLRTLRFIRNDIAHIADPDEEKMQGLEDLIVIKGKPGLAFQALGLA